MPRVEIVDGPGIWGLVLALFDSMPIGNYSRPTYFKVQEKPGDTLHAEATIIGCTKVPGPEVWEIVGEIRLHGTWTKFKATYSTPLRSGSMEYGL
ncbi:MAG: hypothetical protein A2126_01245 [Candidatus Woykebacteria bacterium GWB1_45_5]|uniref:Uncharacterized protein n=2 Tax=Candidatus Woykeibacteriota TaxID=1817899 RepID=A0A1G1W4S4_9BACT|nr:MAG: hypothetical protein A2113_02210 [Candidatus Woykebacteria bacterium GWA1_44_8]OGY22801.1 MAG: hypothetical protein A2126_01245 [Candidatus Woykebacteria bacterium GWB1_45_5]